MNTYLLLGLMVQAFIFTIMLTVGLQVLLEDLKQVILNKSIILKSAFLNLILAPLSAFLIIHFSGFSGPVAMAILLLAAAPGAPFAPRIVEVGWGDLPFATTAVALFSLVAVFSGPVTAQLLVGQSGPGFSTPWRLILILIGFQLLPLAGGIWIHHQKPKLASSMVSPFHIFSNFLIIVIAVVAIWEFGEQFWKLGFQDWLMMLTITLIWMALGLLHWGNGQLIQHTEQMLIPARNIGLALFLTLRGLGNTAIVIPLLAQGAISLFLVPAIGRALMFWHLKKN